MLALALYLHIRLLKIIQLGIIQLTPHHQTFEAHQCQAAKGFSPYAAFSLEYRKPKKATLFINVWQKKQFLGSKTAGNMI